MWPDSAFTCNEGVKASASLIHHLIPTRAEEGPTALPTGVGETAAEPPSPIRMSNTSVLKALAGCTKLPSRGSKGVSCGGVPLGLGATLNTTTAPWLRQDTHMPLADVTMPNHRPTHTFPSPPHMTLAVPRLPQARHCTVCLTTDTSTWRRLAAGVPHEWICNACG